MKKTPRLGQHFLRSTPAIRAVLGAAGVKEGDKIVEIGPGKGVLTEALLEGGGIVYAIEKDSGLVIELKERFSDYISGGKLKIIEGDVLEFSPEDVFEKKDVNYKAVGNIPYYITGAIIRKFLSFEKKPLVLVLMVQKEVAERIVAKSGKESVLSISVKAYGTPKYVRKVPAGSFSPPPKVDSAIIAIENISGDVFEKINEEDFFKLLKTGFAHPRKLVAGNLKSYGEKIKKTLEERGLSKARPENLALSDWKALAEQV